jgi:HAD superfamily hydrolase (TIGR01450 family)
VGKSQQTYRRTDEQRRADSEALRMAQVYFFDLDGCIYHTDQPAPGANEMLALLRSEGKRIGFITNNSRQTATEIADKLERMGFAIPPQEIITATEATGSYLKDRYGILKVKVVGSSSLERSIGQWGHQVLPLSSSDRADTIVIGRDTEFTFDKLQQVVDQEGESVRVVATNPDFFHPGIGGRRIPETGALTAAIEAIIDKQMEYVGKPDPYLFRYAMRTYGITTQKCVMVGDNLNTDIIGGFQAGMTTVWIKGSFVNRSLDDRIQHLEMVDISVEGMEELLSCYQKES